MAENSRVADEGLVRDTHAGRQEAFSLLVERQHDDLGDPRSLHGCYRRCGLRPNRITHADEAADVVGIADRHHVANRRCFL